MAADDSLFHSTGPASGVPDQPAVALLFDRGRRPTAADLAPWALPDSKAALKECPDRLEIFGSGVQFLAIGLAPGPGAAAPLVEHFYGFSAVPDLADIEAVGLGPVMRVARGDGLVPVVRALVDQAVQLVSLPGLIGVAWLPAATMMAPDHFSRAISAWLDGGAFPGLGLTALTVVQGAARSTGLSLFAGHEVEVSGCESAAANAKLALRAIHLLAERGASGYDALVQLADGEFRCQFSADRQTLLIERVRDEAG